MRRAAAKAVSAAASATSTRGKRSAPPTAVKQEAGAAAACQRGQEPTAAAPRKRAATSSAVKKEKNVLVDRPLSPPEPARHPKTGRLIFPDAPDFQPRLTPEQVIRAGSFGGIYFNKHGGKKGIIKYPGGGVPIDATDFPAAWFEGLPVDFYAGRRYRKEVNKYGVVAGQDQAYWEAKGWMIGPDKRGWFQWYCHFYVGRRCADDARQISRWKGVASDTGRWRVTLANRLARAGLAADAAPRVSPVICQTLLHWADELRQSDVESAVKKLKREGKL
jgi:hypothetical protein